MSSYYHPPPRKPEGRYIIGIGWQFSEFFLMDKPPKPKRIHSKFWIFTWYHYAAVQPWVEVPVGVTCIGWQEERCPTTDRLHLQGYVELTRDRELSWLKKHVSQGANFQKKISNSSRLQAFEYTQKSDSRVSGPFCLGTRPVQDDKSGKRTDLIEFRDKCFQGLSARKLWQECPGMMARFPRMFGSIKALARPVRKVDLEVYLLYGKTGCGKTRSVYSDWESDEEFWRWPVPNTACWFDGYDRHELCLLDDFAGKASKMSLVMLLQVLDRYPVLLPIKTSHEWWMPTKICITTNIHPRLWYDWTNRGGQYLALKRRFHYVYDMTIKTEEGEEIKDAGASFWYDPVLFPRPTVIDVENYEHVQKKAKLFDSDQEFFQYVDDDYNFVMGNQ